MQFKDIIGQEALRQNLVHIVRQNRIHPTQLFLGKPGSGALAFVLAYAQFILCEQKQEVDSCGHCRSCKQMASLSHPDVRITFPTVTKKSGEKPISNDFIREFQQFHKEQPFGDLDNWLQFINTKKRPNITARECLEIIKTARFKPVQGKHKINIIWQAELLAKEGNRLLKILEEPPEHTLFLLIAEHEESLLNTILSRAQIHRLQPITDHQVEQFVQTTFQIDEQQSKKIALLAEGNINSAIELAETNHEDYESELAKWLDAMLRNQSKLIDYVSAIASNSKADVKNLLFQGTLLCREALILRESNLQGRMPAQEQKIAEWLGNRLHLQQIQELSTLFEEGIYAVDRNANLNVLLMSISLDVAAIIQQRETV